MPKPDSATIDGQARFTVPKSVRSEVAWLKKAPFTCIAFVWPYTGSVCVVGDSHAIPSLLGQVTGLVDPASDRMLESPAEFVDESALARYASLQWSIRVDNQWRFGIPSALGKLGVIPGSPGEHIGIIAWPTHFELWWPDRLIETTSQAGRELLSNSESVMLDLNEKLNDTQAGEAN